MDRLLELQDLDLSIDRMESRQAELSGGEEVQAARGRTDAVEDRVGTLKLALDSVAREFTRLETEIESFSRKIGDEEKRLFDGSVANPKELQSIRAEVENLKHRRTRTEDELLGQMERREELESELASAEAELQESRDRLAELEGSSATELRELQHGIASRRAERQAVMPAIDEELLELYEDLRAQKKGIGAAALIDRVCMGCRQQLSALEFEQVKTADGIRRCPNCRRILVLG